MRRLLLALLCAWLLSGCTSMFFQPMQAWVRTPADVGLTYEDVRLRSDDGVRLSAWFLPAPGEAQATVLFLHGNAENISTHLRSVYWLPQYGFNVLLLDYRGYGRSQGKPSVAGAQTDIDTAMRYLIARKDIDPGRIFVLAQSLGGALGLHYVAHSAYRAHIKGAVIDSAFVGYRDIAREKLRGFWLSWPLAWPLGLTVTDGYRPLDAAPLISPIPLLIIHGELDQVVPVHHGDELHQAARAPKALWRVPQTHHIQAFEQAAIRQRLVAWFEARLKP
ncbi:MAG: alpha/beta hydrolase [Hylemonella sp.]|nr:alpha/beta hydrolase [Hylemonella sp.]